MTAPVACHRDDGELVGFLTPVDGGWVPTTVFGYPLGEAADRDSAEDLLLAVGLSVLADRWSLFDGDVWLDAMILEARPDEVTVAIVDANVEPYGQRRTLRAPVGTDRLRRR